ncbi:META domain-containing protein [Paracoccus sulfuroxidans]|uniref:Heat shock protein HslJ n=1 Tax=Paracoccus sulfuroxidans TaxID=384678 RepID=A0A562NY79_9RHOB|nr:META domain-containing protein [Paracoccus sulfuroxidans]TWI37033.1 heat shock protein HslJ [Paracoccus sulfuroxidans]
MKQLLIAASLVALSACSVLSENSNAIPGSYRLVDIDGETLTGTATARIEINGAISGQGPCNMFSGANRAALPTLDYAALATTRRACIIEGGEGRFLTALAAVREASTTGDRLVMRGPGVTMTWQRVSDLPAQ